MNIRICIIDDSSADLESVKNTIENLFDNSSISFIFTSASDPKKITGDFDLYVLDIELNGTDGFALAEQIESDYPGSTVIFCTSHEELVFKSFNYRTFYFVRKTCLKEDLENALHKYIRYKNIGSYIVRNSKSMVAVPAARIIYLNVIKNDLYIVTSDKKQYTERKTLTAALYELTEYCFLRISMNTAVNAQYIREIDSKQLVLYDGTKMKISRERTKTVVRDYEKYLLWR